MSYCLKILSLIGIIIIIGFTQSNAQWKRKKDIPLSVSAYGQYQAIALGNDIYIIADGNKLYQYDTAADNWVAKASIPRPSYTNGIMFTANGKAYIGLGVNPLLVPMATRDLWEYDPAANTWTQKGSFPDSGLWYTGCFVIHNKAYVGGGIGYGVINQKFWQYDPAADTWTQKANCPYYKFIAPYTFAIGNNGYFVGGTIDSVTNQPIHSSFIYDAINDVWNSWYMYPGSGNAFGLAYVFNDTAYCGMGGEATDMKCYRYDDTSKTWAYAFDFPMQGVYRSGATAVTVGSRIYVGGGIDNNTSYNDWWVYETRKMTNAVSNISTDEWKIYPNPASEKLYVTGTGKTTCSMYNLSGQKILNDIVGNQLDVRSIPAGQYIIDITTASGHYQKFVEIIHDK